MGDIDEYRCFVGSLSWNTTDRGLKDAFEKYGPLLEAKVVLDKFSGRSRGFGFVSFDDKRNMEEAIEAMNGIDLDGRSITVEKAQPSQGGSRDRDGGDYGRDRDRGRDRGYGGSRGGGGGGGECFKCGKPGHFARECPNDDGDRNGGRYSSRGDRKSGGGYGPDRGSDRGSDRYGGGDRYSGGGGDRYGGGGGDRYGGGGGGGRYRDSGSRGGSGSDRYGRDRSGPYERPTSGGYR